MNLSTFLVSRFRVAALISFPALSILADAFSAFFETSLIFRFVDMISLSIDFFASAALALAFSASAFAFASCADCCGDLPGDVGDLPGDVDNCFLLSMIARSNA